MYDDKSIFEECDEEEKREAAEAISASCVKRLKKWILEMEYYNHFYLSLVTIKVITEREKERERER